MDVNDIIDFAKVRIGDFARWYWSVLSSPLNSGDAIRSDQLPGLTDKQVIANLASFVLICILAGATIGAVIPNRPKLMDRATIAVIATLLWIFIGFLSHGFCKVLRGTGKVGQSISAVVQALAIVYPLSNFAVFLLSACNSAFPSLGAVWEAMDVQSPAAAPGGWIIFIQAAFMAAYLPMLFLRIHGFGLIRGIASSALAVGAASIFGLAIASTGGC
jgi:hypothetical protein